MVDRIYFPEPLQITQPESTRLPKGKNGTGDSQFARILGEKLPADGVRFSQHAQERLRARGITLNETDLRKLEGAVTNVARKGGNESLIMMGDAAFLVSVKNRTVITALDRQAMQDNVFTNIDSAVMVP